MSRGCRKYSYNRWTSDLHITPITNGHLEEFLWHLSNQILLLQKTSLSYFQQLQWLGFFCQVIWNTPPPNLQHAPLLSFPRAASTSNLTSHIRSVHMVCVCGNGQHVIWASPHSVSHPPFLEQLVVWGTHIALVTGLISTEATAVFSFTLST